MTATSVESPNMVLLFDPSDKHRTLDEDIYPFFVRRTNFDSLLNIISTGYGGHIDLHVPIDFDFEIMRLHPDVYIHTYFMDVEDTSILNNIEREKIRDLIRCRCADMGIDYTERGVMDTNEVVYDAAIGLAESLLRLAINHQNNMLS